MAFGWSRMSARCHRFGCQLFIIGALTGSLAPQRAPELPSAIRAQLSAEYPGWRFAKILPALRYELVADPTRRRSEEWVTADFNGDRRPDYAVQIVRAGARDSAQVVIAFLATGGRFRSSVVQVGGEHLGTILTTSTRGARVRDFDKDEMGDSTFVLANDAIVLLYNEGAAATCMYERAAWRCVVSAD